MSRLDATAAILAGGDGSRFGGTNKALLTLEARSFLERQVSVLQPLFRRVLVVAREPEPYRQRGLRAVRDRLESTGAPGAVFTALAEAETPWVFCIACDMPFVSASAVQLLGARCGDDRDVIAAARSGHLEPLFAFYSKRCLPFFARAFESGVPSLQGLLAGLRTHAVTEADLRAVDPELRCLENINTPEDLARVRRDGRGLPDGASPGERSE